MIIDSSTLMYHITNGFHSNPFSICYARIKRLSGNLEKVGKCFPYMLYRRVSLSHFSLSVFSTQKTCNLARIELNGGTSILYIFIYRYTIQDGRRHHRFIVGRQDPQSVTERGCSSGNLPMASRRLRCPLPPYRHAIMCGLHPADESPRPDDHGNQRPRPRRRRQLR